MEACLIDVSGNQHAIKYDEKSTILNIKNELARIMNISSSAINIFNPAKKPVFCSNEAIVSKTITPLRSKLFFQVSYDEQGDNEPCLDLPEDLNSLYNKLRRKVTS